jgi:hypothetical protein
MFMETVKQIENDLVEVVNGFEEPVVTSVGSIVDAVADYVPTWPAWPVMSALPTLSELVDSGVEFTTRFVNQQGEFTRRFVRAFDPILTKVDGRASHAKSVPTRATKSADAKVA